MLEVFMSVVGGIVVMLLVAGAAIGGAIGLAIRVGKWMSGDKY